VSTSSIVGLGEIVAAWGDFQAACSNFTKDLGNNPDRAAIADRAATIFTTLQFLGTAAAPWIGATPIGRVIGEIAIPGVTGGSIGLDVQGIGRAIQNNDLNSGIQSGILISNLPQTRP
jgi:hypothetical protein